MTFLNPSVRCRIAQSGADTDRSRAHAVPRRVRAQAPRLTRPMAPQCAQQPASHGQPPQFAHPSHDNDPTEFERRHRIERLSRADGKPHVLLVDSDDRCAGMVSAVLAPEVHVTRVSSLTDARRAIANDIYSLVILEPYLPDGNGAALVAVLPNTPVLVHTENCPPWRDRVQGFLPKPWSTHRAMWQAVAELLGVPGDLAAEG